MKKVVSFTLLCIMTMILLGCPEAVSSGGITVTPTPEPEVDLTPVVSLISGNHPAGSLNVTISVPKGTTAYYSLDGNDPYPSNTTMYDKPFSITVDETERVIKIIVFETETMRDSGVKIIKYASNETVLSPDFYPESWENVSDYTEFTLTSPTDGAKIYYKASNTAQTTNNPVVDGWALYEKGSAAIQFSNNTSMTYSAIAIKEGMTNSKISSITYYKKRQIEDLSIWNDENEVSGSEEILFSKGLRFESSTQGVTYSYKFSGDTDFISGGSEVSLIPEGSTSITVKAEASGYDDAVQTFRFSKKYAIGEIGPGGGIIFNYDSDTGEGKEVSDRISDNGNTWFTWYQASEVAENHTTVVNGRNYYDWELPTKDELNEIYLSLRSGQSPIIMENAWLWSSSEYNSTDAWGQNFGSGAPSYDNRNVAGGVRTVRAFDI